MALSTAGAGRPLCLFGRLPGVLAADCVGVHLGPFVSWLVLPTLGGLKPPHLPVGCRAARGSQTGVCCGTPMRTSSIREATPSLLKILRKW